MLFRSKATHRSPYGEIESAWHKQNGRFNWEIEVPPNTTATVYVPAASADAVTESGKPLAKVKGVKLLRVEAGRVVLEVGSGEYHFVAR